VRASMSLRIRLAVNFNVAAPVRMCGGER